MHTRHVLGRLSGIRRAVLGVAVAAAVIGMLATGPSAQAGKGWCRVDPVVIIDGQVTDIFVGSDPSALLTTTGPIQIVVTVPAEMSATHVISDLGFGRGYDFSIVESSQLVATADSVPVDVEVYVPATGDALPVSVYFAPRLLGLLQPASTDGHANAWVELTTSV